MNDSILVVYNAPPVVLILTPESGTVLPDPSIDVEGVVDDVSALVSVNGIVATVDSGGRFVASGVPLVIGTNALVARAVDPLGAAGRDDSEVTRDDDVLGEIRIVMLSPVRVPFLIEDDRPPGVPIVAYDLSSFLSELQDRTAIDPALYKPELTQISIGVAGMPAPPKLYFYVFVGRGELGQDVRLQDFNPQVLIDDSFAPLQPLSDLSLDLQSLGLDVSLIDRLIPVDFDPNGFVRFDIPLFGLGGGGGGLFE